MNVVLVGAGYVWLGTHLLLLGTRGFATATLVLIVVWLALARLLVRDYRRKKAAGEARAA